VIGIQCWIRFLISSLIRGLHFSHLGGRFIIINVIISAVPLYMLSLYKLSVLIRKRMDRIRCQFFWQGSSSKKDYALVA
jgi:hypothetical protein